jgi:pyridoxine 5-phosphate synthase
VKKLSVNIDHVATLRQARQETFPDPVQAAVMAELGGADGITVHLRQDRRHVNERDVTLLKATIKTELNMELAALPEMSRIALKVGPAQVSLVPETPAEVTTQGGLDLARNLGRIAPIARKLRQAGIRLSVFIEADRKQIEAAARLGCDMIEINTDRYGRLSAPDARDAMGTKLKAELARIQESVAQAKELNLLVHAGHGIDYHNIVPLLRIEGIEGFSIGFAIVARAVFTGLKDAVCEMKRIMDRGWTRLNAEEHC